jgi:hypothetical protein
MSTASVEILRPHPVSYLTDVYRYEAGELALTQRTIAALRESWGAAPDVVEHLRKKAVAQLVKVEAAHRAVKACLTGEEAPDADPET